MSELSFQDRIANRLRQESEKEKTDPINDRFLRLQDASRRNVEKLLSIDAQNQADLQADRESWAGQLGRDPNTDFIGNIVNKAAWGIDGTARIAGQIAGAIPTAQGDHLLNAVPESAREAYGRLQNGTASPEDESLLNSFMPTPRDEMAWEGSQRELDKPEFTDETYLDRISRARKNFDLADGIRDFAGQTQGITHKKQTRQLQESLGASFDEQMSKMTSGWELVKNDEQFKGLAEIGKALPGLLVSIGAAAAENPDGALDYITNNLPQLYLAAKGGGAGMVASTVPYAIDAYGQGIRDYAEKNQGALPDAKELERMAMYAVSLAGSEYIGNIAMLGGVKSMAKGAADVAEEVSRTGLKKALGLVTENAPGRVIGAGGKGGAGEFGTEAWQTFAENQIKNEETTLKDAFIGGSIGAISGGGLSGGKQVLQEVAEGAAEASKGIAERAANKAAIERAAENNDPSVFLDPKTKDYSPTQAIDVLHTFAKKEDTTPEIKEANVKKASEVVTSVQERLASTQEDLALLTPEGIQPMIEAARAEGNTDRVEALEAEVAELQAKPVSEAEIKQMQDKVAALEKLATETQTRFDTMAAEMVQPAAEIDVEASLADLSSPDTEVSQKAANNIINLSMAGDASLTVEQLDAAIADTSNGLTAEQRAYLRQSSDARVLANSLQTEEGVSDAVYFGKGKDVGIVQYRERVAKALAINDTAAAERHLKLLSKFTNDHTAKHDAAQKALAQFNALPADVRKAIRAEVVDGVRMGPQIVRTKAGMWEAHARPVMTPKEIRKNEGLILNKTSLVEAIGAESKALKATLAELQSAVQLKSSKPTVDSTTTSTTTQSAPAAVLTEATTVQGQNQSKVDSTVDSKTSTPAASTEAAQKAPVVASTSNLPRNQVGKDANSFTNQNAQLSRDTADRLRITAEIEALFAEGKTVNQVVQELGDKLKSVDKTERSGFVTGVRATLGIPSQADTEGQAEFKVWKAERDARQGNKTTQSAPSSVESAPSPVSDLSTKSVEKESRLKEEDSSKSTNQEGTLSVTASKVRGYRERTQRNANAADVTIAFAADFTTAGERLTRNVAGRNYVAYDGSVDTFVKAIVAKLKAVKGKTINVAGNGIYTWIKFDRDQAWVNESVFDILSQVKEQYPAFEGIVTGGQTGTDIAGAIAAHALGLNVDVHMPQGFLQRNAQGKDFTQTADAVTAYIKKHAKTVGKTQTQQARQTAQTPLTPELLNKISDLRGGMPIRSPNFDESLLIASILEELEITVGLDLLDQVAGVVVMDPKEAISNSGFALRLDGKIYLGIKASALAMKKHPTTMESGKRYVTRVLTHELGHVFDNSFREGELVSDQKAFGKGGSIRTEVEALVATELKPFWKRFFQYPFSRASESEVRKELFAQLFAMYHIYPEVMNAQLPITKARFDAVYGRATSSDTQAQTEAGQSSEGGLPTGRRVRDAGTDGRTNTTEEASQEVVAETAAVDPGTTPPTSGLRVFSQFNKEWVGQKLQDYFRKVNPIAQFMTQQIKSDRTKIQRPLVAVSNLMSAIKANQVKFTDYLPLDPVTGEVVDFRDKTQQRLALENMRDTILGWLPEIAANMRYKAKKSEDFLTEDMMRFFFETDPMTGKVIAIPEENVQSAIAYSAYHYINDKATGLAVKDAEEIATMHGQDKETELTAEGEALLRRMDSFENTAIDELGEIALQALGIKARPGTPQNLLPRLKTALGVHALMLLESSKDSQGNPFIIRRAIPQRQVMEAFLFGEGKSLNMDGVMEWDRESQAIQEPTPTTNTVVTNKYVEFVWLKEGRKHALPERVRTIKDANKGSANVVDDFFGVEKAPKFATVTPMEFTQTTARGTNQAIPETQLASMKELAKTPHKVIDGMLSLVQALGDTAILKIAGWVDLEKTAVHISERDSVQAQNENLENQFDLAMEMGDSHGWDSEFYVMPFVARNFRTFIDTQSLNQQTSKIHRGLFSRPEWTATLDLNNEDLMNEFLLSVAMNLDFKTDETVNAVTLPKAMAFLQSKDITRAATLIGQGITKEDHTVFTPDNVRFITEVAASNNGMMGLQALLAYSEYLLAQEANAQSPDSVKEITITMLVGADGKTSGPMLTHAALGAATTSENLYDILYRGGFYKEGASEPKHFAEYASQGAAKDLYKWLASHILENSYGKVMGEEELEAIKKKAIAGDKTLWKEYFKHFTLEQFQALEVITSALRETQQGEVKVTSAGRNLVKTPLTAFGFGSALSGSIKSMKKKFIKGIYATVADMANKKKKAPDVLKFIRALNTLIAMGDYKADLISENASVEGLLESVLKPKQEAAILNAFERIIGKSTAETMDEDFDMFMRRRDALNKTIQGGYTMFEVAYAEARKTELDHLMDSGDVAWRLKKDKKGNVTREPIHDLTPEQEAVIEEKLKVMLPTMHTSMSLKENNLDAGVMMAKSEKKASSDPLYRSTVNFQNETVATTGKRETSLPAAAFTRVRATPGIAGLSYLIHSLDGGIMDQAMRRIKNVLSIHDEGAGGVQQVKAIAYELNKATAEQLLAFSPAAESVRMFQRLVLSTAGRIHRGEISAEGARKIIEGWADVVNYGVPKALHLSAEFAGKLLLEATYANAYNADRVRLEAFSTLGHVDQYPWEGGQFEVPQSMRDEAKKKLARVERIGSAPPANVTAAMEFIIDAGLSAEREWNQEGELVKSEPESAPAKTERTSTPGNWGEVGTPIHQDLNKGLEQALLVRGEMTATEVLDSLEKTYPEGSFNHKLLKALRRAVSPNLKIKLIRPDTPQSAVLAPPDMENSRGWFVADPDNKTEEIYLLSSEFVQAGTSLETLLHELVHGAVAEVIAKELKTKNPQSPAYQLVQELEGLLKDAQAYAKANKITKYGAALSGIQELVAWGMSNLDFQQDVLMKVETSPINEANTLVKESGMQKFIRTLVGLIYPPWAKSNNELAINGMAKLISSVSGLMNQAQQTKGQGPTQPVNQSQQGKGPVDSARALTTVELFDALESEHNPVDAEFKSHLKDLLEGIVENLHGPFGTFKAAMDKDMAMSALDVFQKAQDTGQAPFASKILAQPFNTPDQVAMVMEQVEATVRAGLVDNTSSTTVAYKELYRLYKEAQKKLAPKDFYQGDWATAPQHEKDNATALHAFLFDLSVNQDGSTDYLARFAAMGLAHPQVNALLKFDTDALVNDAKPGDTFLTKLQRVFEKILRFLNGRLTHTFDGQRADQKLTNLVDQLVDIEAKKRKKVAKREASRLAQAEDFLGEVGEKAKQKVANVARADFFKKNRFPLVRGTAGAVVTIAEDRVGLVMEGITKIRNKVVKQKYGTAMKLVNYIRGPEEMFQTLLRETKDIEKHRTFVNVETGKAVLESFSNKGVDLKQETKVALTATFLRTDMGPLLDHFGMAGIKDLVTSRQRLHDEIQSIENALQEFKKLSPFYIKQAHALGYFMATGIARIEGLKQNAHSIARMLDMPQASQISAQQAQKAEVLIDRLASLRALQHTSSQNKAMAAEVLNREMARTDGGNGVLMLIKQHQELLADSKARLFQGSEVLATKGYLPEIVDPHVEGKVATEAEGYELELQGWRKSAPVPKDPSDPNQTVKHLYILKDGGLSARVTGNLSLTSEQMKGSQVTQKVGAITATQKAALQQQFKPDPTFNPDKVGTSFLVPVVNTAGETVKQRYIMQHHTRDTLFNRDNRFEKVLGTMAGNTFDKEASTEQNKRVVDAIKELYDADYSTNSSEYVQVGMNSSDPELREIYRLLPQETRNYIRKTWGYDAMVVRKDVLDINFGYRKYSVTEMFDKAPKDRNFTEKTLVRLTETAVKAYAIAKGLDAQSRQGYEKRARLVARVGERVWQDVIKEIKDIIVIKTGVVLVGNISANLSLLYLNKVPITTWIKHHRVAYKGATAYQENTAERFQLQNQLDTGYLGAANEAEIRRRIAELNDLIQRNPARQLIESGLMPTIVEDISMKEDIYSYKSKLARMTEKYTDKLNPGVKAVGKQVFMTHDTKAYQTLHHMTQLSDFMARYTLYQHLTTRAKNPMTHEAAIQRASESFINYDIPMPKGIQYLDDSGLVLFTKYLLGIQRVLMDQMKESPVRTLSMISLANMYDIMPVVTDTLIWNRLGYSPLRGGALDYPGTLGDIATVDAAMGLFK